MPTTSLSDISWLFQQMMIAECLTQVLEAAEKKQITITRNQLIQILRNPQHRESIVSGSQFDLVQNKLNTEQDIEQNLKQCSKQGMSWRDAVFTCHIGPGPDYSRLRSWYEHLK